jgi:hypothetical protein
MTIPTTLDSLLGVSTTAFDLAHRSHAREDAIEKRLAAALAEENWAAAQAWALLLLAERVPRRGESIRTY